MPKNNVANIYFKYHGVIDFHRLMSEGKKFWVDRRYKFYEKVYKHKGNEFEGKWEIRQKYDMYNELVYVIEFKAIEMDAFTQDGKELFRGKLQLSVDADFTPNYEEGGVAGPKVLFTDKSPDKLSFLHKLYKKMTYREREEGISSEAHIRAHEFEELVKRICNVEAKDG